MLIVVLILQLALFSILRLHVQLESCLPTVHTRSGLLDGILLKLLLLLQNSSFLLDAQFLSLWVKLLINQLQSVYAAYGKQTLLYISRYYRRLPITLHRLKEPEVFFADLSHLLAYVSKGGAEWDVYFHCRSGLGGRCSITDFIHSLAD